MYFAHWTAHSMVLPDQDAAEIYQNTGDIKKDPEQPIPVAKQDTSDPEYPNAKTGTSITGPAQNNLNKTYQAAPITAALRYGHQYEFRVRLRDLSGGGAEHGAVAALESASAKATCRFKRY